MIKRFLLMSLFCVFTVYSDVLDDSKMLLEGIKRVDISMVYTALNKGTIDFKECGEFDYLDLACCKLVVAIEKIEHYKDKLDKWKARIDSEYDQELVKNKVIQYTTLSEKWSTLKKKIQYIVQLIALYLGLSQENIDAIEDLATDVLEVVADISEMSNKETLE